MKDLSFLMPILDRRWLGLGVRPSAVGTNVTKVECMIEHSPATPGFIVSDPWWRISIGHIEWGIRTDHPAELALLEFAWRHSP